jgi:hypothetical protein
MESGTNARIGKSGSAESILTAVDAEAVRLQQE